MCFWLLPSIFCRPENCYGTHCKCSAAQDCTVQHLRDEQTVSIYEAAARAALQYGDHAEYNQCQTQLNALHGDGVPGSRAEFLAYRLLYQTVHAASGEAVALAAAMRLAAPQVCCAHSFAL